MDLFKIRFYDNTDNLMKTIEFCLSVYEGSTEQFSVGLEGVDTALLDSLEVLPVIIRGGNPYVCEEQVVSSRIDMSDC